MNMSIFRRSLVVVVSQSNRNCDIGFTDGFELLRHRRIENRINMNITVGFERNARNRADLHV